MAKTPAKKGQNEHQHQSFELIRSCGVSTLSSPSVVRAEDGVEGRAWEQGRDFWSGRGRVLEKVTGTDVLTAL